MKPSKAAANLILMGSFLTGAVRAWAAAHDLGMARAGGLLGIARGRSWAARSCYRSWLYHCRHAGCFAEEVAS
jgi:hypothetical protein